jgi:dCMP deaminase
MSKIDCKWDIRFMRIAREISMWSKDPSSKIGAVIVNDERRILATGYNGFPRGIEDTPERLNDKEQKYPRIIHAEMNALMGALYSGVSVKGATIYVYGLPVCSDCTKSIIQAGIKKVIIGDASLVKSPVWREQWENMSSKMLEEAGVEIVVLNQATASDSWRDFYGI